MPGRFLSLHVQWAALALLLVLVPKSLQSPEPVAPLTRPPAGQGANPLAVQRTEAPAPPAPASPATDKTVQQAASVTATARPEKKPSPAGRVAILIDDMGYNLDAGRQLLDLDLPLSFSFLPQAPHTRELAQSAHARGRTVLVHLPMEPKDRHRKEEPLMLQVGDTEDQLREKSRWMLAAVPGATGANNHMGSRFTEQQREMRQVLSTLRERGLFFVDSATTAASVAETTARRLGIPTARRRVFLDNDQRESAICTQMAVLADLAAQEGEAIAIGHPNQGMVAAFIHCAAHHLAGVELVGVEQVVH